MKASGFSDPQPNQRQVVTGTHTTPPEHIATLKAAIQNRHLRELESQLNTIKPDHETFKELLAQAQVSQPKFRLHIQTLLNYAELAQSGHLEVALQHAIATHDMKLARQALLKAANPHDMILGKASNEMCELITYARRFVKLYPSAGTHQYTALDKALRAVLTSGSKAHALRLLRKETATIPEVNLLSALLRRTEITKSTEKAWGDAVKKNQLDVQCAILLLKADETRRFRTAQTTEVTDPRIKKVMKEIPYFSSKRKRKRFNGLARFDKSQKEIACSHIVTDWLRRKLSHVHGKLYLNTEPHPYGNVAKISKNVSETTGVEFDELRASAREMHLFQNRNLGQKLITQFEAMEQAGEPVRLMLLTSIEHAMGIELRIKDKDGVRQYVVVFFDPNITTSHVRMATDTLNTLEKLTLKDLVFDDEDYKLYCPEPNAELSMMYVINNPNQPSDRTQVASLRGKLTSMEVEDITPQLLYFMLEGGFAEDIRGLAPRVKELVPENERAKLLAAKSHDGNTGIYWALIKGNADTVRAFGELLKLVPENERAELLATKGSDGNTGAYWALNKGHADTVRAFGELRKLVPEKERAALPAASSTRINPKKLLRW